MKGTTHSSRTSFEHTRGVLGRRLSVGRRSSAAACVAFGAILGLVALLFVMIPTTTTASQKEGETSRLLATDRITARTTLPCDELATVSLVGPTTGRVGVSYTFTATTSPTGADLPIVYTWEATGQDSIPPRLGELTDSIQFTWHVAGSPHVTVTATNCLMAATATAHRIITIEKWYTYLPLALKKVLYDPYEPNDTPGNAYGPLVSGQTYFGYFPNEVDRSDYYKIHILTTKKVSAQLGVPSGLDLNLWAYDVDSQLVAGSGNVGDGVDEALEFVPAKTGTYYLRVHRPVAGPGQDDPYTLVATFDTP